MPGDVVALASLVDQLPDLVGMGTSNCPGCQVWNSASLEAEQTLIIQVESVAG